MARTSPGASEDAVQSGGGTLAAATAGPWVALDGAFNIALWGAGWTGPVALECSFDGGTTVIACQYSDQSPIVFNTNGQVVAPAAVERSVVYRLNRGAGTGTLNWRLSR